VTCGPAGLLAVGSLTAVLPMRDACSRFWMRLLSCSLSAFVGLPVACGERNLG
jgi:hypothetical protein